MISGKYHAILRAQHNIFAQKLGTLLSIDVDRENGQVAYSAEERMIHYWVRVGSCGYGIVGIACWRSQSTFWDSAASIGYVFIVCFMNLSFSAPSL